MDDKIRNDLVEKYVKHLIPEIRHIQNQAISDAYNQGYEDGVEWANDKAIIFKPSTLP